MSLRNGMMAIGNKPVKRKKLCRSIEGFRGISPSHGGFVVDDRWKLHILQDNSL
jgi:hypothetical protein